MKEFNIGVRINLNEELNDIIEEIQNDIKEKTGSKPSKEEVIKESMLIGMHLFALLSNEGIPAVLNGVDLDERHLIPEAVQLPEAIVQIQDLINTSLTSL